MNIQVLDKTIWSFGESSIKAGGMVGQLTKCKVNDIVFYVRENLKGINTFHITSGERWGDKTGMREPRKERQSLDLLAPKEHWDMIAALVHEQDHMKRPVLKAKSFTWEWAEKEFI